MEGTLSSICEIKYLVTLIENKLKMLKILYTLFFLMIIYSSMFAQQNKNQLAFSIGAASSLAGSVLSLDGDENSRITPVINANADLGLNTKFSLGLSYCYQSFDFPIYYYLRSSNSSYKSDVSLKRQNMGVRFIFHFLEKKDFDFFGGLRMGYMFHKFSETAPAGYNGTFSYSGFNLIGGKKNKFTQQILIGGKYYWNETFGVMGELAIGFPYAFNFGLGMRIN